MSWVPHLWLRVLADQRLRHFLKKGPLLDLITDETLAARGDEMSVPTISRVLTDAAEEQSGHSRSRQALKGVRTDLGPPPDVDAENSIPDLWSVSLLLLRTPGLN